MVVMGVEVGSDASQYYPFSQVWRWTGRCPDYILYFSRYSYKLIIIMYQLSR